MNHPYSDLKPMGRWIFAALVLLTAAGAAGAIR